MNLYTEGVLSSTLYRNTVTCLRAWGFRKFKGKPHHPCWSLDDFIRWWFNMSWRALQPWTVYHPNMWISRWHLKHIFKILWCYSVVLLNSSLLHYLKTNDHLFVKINWVSSIRNKQNFTNGSHQIIQSEPCWIYIVSYLWTIQ